MKTTYFSHDSNARNSEKLIRLRMRHGAEGYGVYFMILERLRETSGYSAERDYQMMAFDFRVDACLVQSVVEDFGLFVVTDDGSRFYSESFNIRMAMKDGVSEKRRAAASKRWQSKETASEEAPDDDAKEMQVQSKKDANAVENQCKESKEKEKKVNEKTTSPLIPPCRGRVAPQRGVAKNF